MENNESKGGAGPKVTPALVAIATMEDRLAGEYARGILFACGISSALSGRDPREALTDVTAPNMEGSSLSRAKTRIVRLPSWKEPGSL